jgi:ABC-type Fe3+ transport system permease subunit
MIGMITITSMQTVIYVAGSFLGFSLCFAVIVFTLVLVVQLKRKSKWRSKSNMDQARSEAISTRETKTMNMVAMIATVCIICYTPSVAIATTSFIVPEIDLTGKYVNLFHVLWSCAFVFQAVNSSVNIFLYYKMSTKFRDTFIKIFITWKKVAPADG